MRYVKKLRGIYNGTIKRHKEEPRFLILTSFLLTFIVTRAIVYTINGSNPPSYFGNVYIYDTHIHHLVFGIVLLLIAGFIRIPQFGSTLVRVSSVLYGMGAALTLDEFALWLRLNPKSYFGPEGRISIDAIVVFALILLSTLWHGAFWRKTIRFILSIFRLHKKIHILRKKTSKNFDFL